MVKFCVVLKTDFLPVRISDNGRIFVVFEDRKFESHIARRILRRTSFN